MFTEKPWTAKREHGRQGDRTNARKGLGSRGGRKWLNMPYFTKGKKTGVGKGRLIREWFEKRKEKEK